MKSQKKSLDNIVLIIAVLICLAYGYIIFSSVQSNSPKNQWISEPVNE